MVRSTEQVWRPACRLLLEDPLARPALSMTLWVERRGMERLAWWKEGNMVARLVVDRWEVSAPAIPEMEMLR